MLGANEMRTNMVIPTPILELIKFRVSNAHKYRAVLGAEMYTLEDSLAAGLLDEVVDQDLLTSAVNEKAQDLATMGHPSYSMTKELFIADPMSKINTAMEELKNNS
jgi:enoyl-CoA hydratase